MFMNHKRSFYSTPDKWESQHLNSKFLTCDEAMLSCQEGEGQHDEQ